jgi:hypothetical protein
MPRFLTAACLAAVIAAGAGRADDGPVLPKLKKPGPSDVVKHTTAERVTLRTAVTMMGMTQTRDEESRTSFAFTERVLAKPDEAAPPTKLERAYEKAEVVTQGAAADLGLGGKTVLIEKTGDRYEFTSGGQPLAGKAREILAKEFRGRADSLGERFLPEKPVRVGATWKPDGAEFAKWLGPAIGLTFDPAKTTCTAKLTKLYKKDGRQFGVMTVDVTLFATKLDAPGTELPLTDGSKLTIRAEFDNCIDGSAASGRTKITAAGKLAARLDNGTVTLTLTSSLVSTGEELKKSSTP